MGRGGRGGKMGASHEHVPPESVRAAGSKFARTSAGAHPRHFAPALAGQRAIVAVGDTSGQTGLVTREIDAAAQRGTGVVHSPYPPARRRRRPVMVHAGAGEPRRGTPSIRNRTAAHRLACEAERVCTESDVGTPRAR